MASVHLATVLLQGVLLSQEKDAEFRVHLEGATKSGYATIVPNPLHQIPATEKILFDSPEHAKSASGDQSADADEASNKRAVPVAALRNDAIDLIPHHGR
jgi:hypothetical protein